MFLISFIFYKPTNRKKPNEEGAFYLTLSEKCVGEDGTAVWKSCNVTTGIKSADGTLTDEIREELVRMVRLMYSIIEKFDSSREKYDRNDVMSKFKLALKNDASMQEDIEQIQTDFPLRADLVRVGNELKQNFQFVHNITPSVVDESDTLNGFLLKKRLDFKNIGKEATARSYASTAKSLIKFTGESSVNLSEIDKDFVSRYSDWLKENGVSDSTQSFYLRTFRSALNYASEEKGISIKDNLFGGLNTKIYKASPDSSSEKLTRDLLQKISALDLRDDKEAELLRDMFMFSFYCQGLELSDVLNLKKENLIDGKLVYNRRKKGRTIEIVLDKSAKEILDKYKDSVKEYLFPLMETYQGYLYHSIFERVRKIMHGIGDKVGCKSLSFKSNITAWRQIVSQLDLSAIILGDL